MSLRIKIETNLQPSTACLLCKLKVKLSRKKIKLTKGKIAVQDINLTYRKGDFVPIEIINDWQSRGIDISIFFNKRKKTK